MTKAMIPPPAPKITRSVRTRLEHVLRLNGKRLGFQFSSVSLDQMCVIYIMHS